MHFLLQKSTKKAPLYVLVHGLGDSMERMAAIGGELRRQGNNVLLVDLHGHGRTYQSQLQRGDKPPKIIPFENQVTDLSKLVLRVRTAEVDLVGHSYGGAVALAVAERLGATSPVNSVNLLAPYVVRLDTSFRANAPWMSAFKLIGPPELIYGGIQIKQSRWEDPFFDASQMANVCLNAFLGGHEGMIAALHGIRHINFITVPPKLNPKTKLRIWLGTKDFPYLNIAAKDFAEVIQRRGHREVLVRNVPHRGHRFPQEEPRWIANEILQRR